LIGSLLNFSLYGVLAVQVYVYRLTFPHDKRSIKWLIYSVFSLQTALTAVNGADIYYWFAAGFGDVVEFSQPRFSPFYTPVAGSAMALIVQTFFCYPHLHHRAEIALALHRYYFGMSDASLIKQDSKPRCRHHSPEASVGEFPHISL
ncbi:hypothetical protein B0H14DRAFT_2337328, partial [Mycena olivaceomarginata]